MRRHGDQEGETSGGEGREGLLGFMRCGVGFHGVWGFVGGVKTFGVECLWVIWVECWVNGLVCGGSMGVVYEEGAMMVHRRSMRLA